MRLHRLWLLLSLVSLASGLKGAEASGTTKPSDFDAAELFALGTKYYEGTDIPKDDVEAIKYFRKAAERGNAKAQDRLGTMLADGVGVSRDYVEALAWFNVAAVGGSKPFVENRDALERKIGIEATLKAQVRSKELMYLVEAMKAAAISAAGNPSTATQSKEKGRSLSSSKLKILSAESEKQMNAATNVGVTGIDARWSEYGEYLNEVLEIIQIKWYSILKESRLAPPKGSHVVIIFRINSKGAIAIAKAEDAGAGTLGVAAAQNAITHSQPYKKWTEQMVAVLGDSQQITLSFYYQ